MIVPDTIQPYEGWKSLTIKAGLLTSPQRGTVWRPGERLEASCPSTTSHQWLTVAQPGIARLKQPLATISRQPDGRYTYTTPQTGHFVYTHARPIQLAQSLRVRLPDGTIVNGPDLTHGDHWELHETPHRLEACSCGIYVVDHPDQATPYLDNNGVLCQVAVWGETVPGSRGARGQYAYPQKLHCLRHQEPVVARIAKLYQIPHQVIDNPYHDPAVRRAYRLPPKPHGLSTSQKAFTSSVWAACATTSLTLMAAQQDLSWWTALNTTTLVFGGFAIASLWKRS